MVDATRPDSDERADGLKAGRPAMVPLRPEPRKAGPVGHPGRGMRPQTRAGF